MAKIVLAHGILGFGSVLPTQPLEYFNGIKPLYEGYGHEVLCPSVPPLGSLIDRAEALERQILARWPNAEEPIFALAHSMGGLDCRKVIKSSAHLAGRIRRLITVATPHFGSPVASTVLSTSSVLGFSPLQWILDLFRDDAGALEDLQSREKLQNGNVANVEYLCIGCNAALTTPHSALFSATALAGGLWGLPNDGVVTLASASLTNNSKDLWQEWPLDHGGAIGWPSGGTGGELIAAASHHPTTHIERYLALLPTLVR